MSEKKREFKDVAGKVVEQVNVYEEEDGVNQVEIRFQDKTGLAIVLDNKLVLESAELRDWRDGEGELIKLGLIVTTTPSRTKAAQRWGPRSSEQQTRFSGLPGSFSHTVSL